MGSCSTEVMLYLDADSVEEAKNPGINLSQFVECDLRIFVKR